MPPPGFLRVTSFQLRDVEDYYSCSSSEADFNEARSEFASVSSYAAQSSRVGSDVNGVNLSSPSLPGPGAAASGIQAKDSAVNGKQQVQVEDNAANAGVKASPAADALGQLNEQRLDLGSAADIERDMQEGFVVDALSDPKLEHEHPSLEEEEPANKRRKDQVPEPRSDDKVRTSTSAVRTPSLTARARKSSKSLGSASAGLASSLANGPEPTTPAVGQPQPLKVVLHAVPSPDGKEEQVALEVTQVLPDGMFLFGANGFPADTQLPVIPDSNAGSPSPDTSAGAGDAQSASAQPGSSSTKVSPRNDPAILKDQADKSARSGTAPAGPLKKLFSMFRGSKAGSDALAMDATAGEGTIAEAQDGTTLTTVDVLAADVAAATAQPIMPSAGVPVEVNVAQVELHAPAMATSAVPAATDAAAVAGGSPVSPKAITAGVISPRDTMGDPRTPVKDQTSPFDVPTGAAAVAAAATAAAAALGASPGVTSIGGYEEDSRAERELPGFEQLCAAPDTEQQAAEPQEAGVAAGASVTLEGESSLPALEVSDSPVLQSKPAVPGGPDDYELPKPEDNANEAGADVAAAASPSQGVNTAGAAAAVHPSPRTTAKRAFTTVAQVVRMIVPGFRSSTVNTSASATSSPLPAKTADAADTSAADEAAVKALVSKAFANVMASPSAPEDSAVDAPTAAVGVSVPDEVQGVADAAGLDGAAANGAKAIESAEAKVSQLAAAVQSVAVSAVGAAEDAASASTKRKADEEELEVDQAETAGRTTPKAPRLVVADGITAAAAEFTAAANTTATTAATAANTIIADVKAAASDAQAAVATRAATTSNTLGSAVKAADAKVDAQLEAAAGKVASEMRAAGAAVSGAKLKADDTAKSLMGGMAHATAAMEGSSSGLAGSSAGVSTTAVEAEVQVEAIKAVKAAASDVAAQGKATVSSAEGAFKAAVQDAKAGAQEVVAAARAVPAGAAKAAPTGTATGAAPAGQAGKQKPAGLFKQLFGGCFAA